MKSASYSAWKCQCAGPLVVLSLFVLCQLIYSSNAHGSIVVQGRREQSSVRRNDGSGQVVVARGPACLQQLPEGLGSRLWDCTLLEGLNPQLIRQLLNAGEPVTIPVADMSYSIKAEQDRELYKDDAIKGLEPEQGSFSTTLATSNSFIGSFVGSPGSKAGITISEDDRFIYGFGRTSPYAGDQIYFESLVETNRLIFRVLTYRGSDIRMEFTFRNDQPVPSTALKSMNEFPLESEVEVPQPQIVIAHGDGTYLASMGGSVTGVFANMEAVIALVRSWYQEYLNVELQIGELWLKLSNFGPTSGWPLHDAFAAHMESVLHQPAAMYHVAQLFTGVELADYVVGVGGLPSRTSYGGHWAVARMVPTPATSANPYDASLYSKAYVLAHETGHPFDALHDPVSACPDASGVLTIMCGGGNTWDVRNTSFSADNTTRIRIEAMRKVLR